MRLGQDRDYIQIHIKMEINPILYVFAYKNKIL